jgi:cupin fold WbuC family metalloprotein
MEKIYSESGELLHIYYSLQSADQSVRVNISPEEEIIQVACLRLPKGKTFKAHQHIENIRKTTTTQESWVVIKGMVKVYYYDTGGKIIATRILSPGDCTVTLKGGHNYESLDDSTIVYEFKNGPYVGIEKDKVFI